jgi:hypothetical protein
MQVPSNIQGNPLAQSEDYISDVSTLHQGLSRTTAMPALDQFKMYNNSMSMSTQFKNNMSITPEPQVQSMFPAKELSRLQATMDNTSPPVANFAVSALQINMVL